MAGTETPLNDATCKASVREDNEKGNEKGNERGNEREAMREAGINLQCLKNSTLELKGKRLNRGLEAWALRARRCATLSFDLVSLEFHTVTEVA